MRNVTISLSDKAYVEVREWADKIGVSLSAAVEGLVVSLPNTRADMETGMLINSYRHSARAHDRVARGQAVPEKSRKASVRNAPESTSQPQPAIALLSNVLKKYAETVQKSAASMESTS